MSATAISYGTAIWLAELKMAGWTLTASEKRYPFTSQVGVLATDEAGSGVFVPCADKTEAYRLLEQVDDELAGIA